MRKIIFLAASIYLYSCSSSKVNQEVGLLKQTEKANTLPIWIAYNELIPDSIRDFVKVYTQAKKKQVVNMQEAVDLIFEKEQAAFMDNVPSNNISESDFLNNLQKARKPVCNFLMIQKIGETAKPEIESNIKWFVLQKPSLDTLKIYHYYSIRTSENTHKEWMALMDTIFASGLLK